MGAEPAGLFPQLAHRRAGQELEEAGGLHHGHPRQDPRARDGGADGGD